MKYIILTQVNIKDEKGVPKITKLGKVAINPECIMAIHHIIDSFEDVIPGVIRVVSRTNEGFIVAGEFDELAEKLAASDYVTD